MSPASRSDFLLETERLGLRPFRLEDFDDLVAILGDEETGRGLWAVVLKDSGEFVGDCGVTDQLVDGVTEPEIGWHVNRAHWRHGIAIEAAIAHRDRAFGELGQQRLISLIRPENVASCRVAEKLGMAVQKETERVGMTHLVYSMAAP